jgi:integrase
MDYLCGKFITQIMATFKVLILPTQKKADGTYNVKIRVTHNRKSKYIKTPHYVGGTDIYTRKGELKIKNQAVLDAMEEVVVSYKKKMVKAGMDVDNWDVERLVDYLEHSDKKFQLDLIAYGHAYGDALLAKGKDGTGRSYHIAMNSLKRFLGRDTLDISEVTVKFLNAYEAYLRTEPVYKGKRKGEAVPTTQQKKGRAVSLYIGKIKTLHEAAKREFNDEERGIINIPFSPFSKYTVPSPNVAEHRVLTIEQMQKIIDLPYKEHKHRGLSQYNMGKDLFVLSFGLMGINTADLYDDGIKLDGDVLSYCRKKTRARRKDNAAIKIKVEPEIMAIVKKYWKDGKFMFAEHYSTPLNMNKMINAGLKKVGEAIGVKGLNYYYARHTMASICANKLGIDIARVDEMLNHSDPKLALARVYIEKDFKPLWEANRKLIDLFDWSFYKEKAEE